MAFTVKDNMDKHILLHNEPVSILVCNQCDNTFTDDASLENHLILHSDLVSKNSCKPCNRTFTDKAALEIHMGLHSDVESKCTSSLNIHLHIEAISVFSCF